MLDILREHTVLLSKAGVAGLCGVAAVVAVAALWVLYSRSHNMSHSEFKRMFRRSWGFRVWALALSAVFALAMLAPGWRLGSGRAEMVVTLNYAEASWGANANGTRYNSSEILCDEVLERAIEMGAFDGVTPADLRACLSIAPLVEGGSSSEEEYHIATEFLVSYEADDNTAHLDAENVLKLIASAYKFFYIDHYANNFSVLDMDLDAEALEGLDYLDTVTYLQNRATRVMNYMYVLGDENASFLSSRGDSFYSLASKVSNLIDFQIQDRLASYLLENGVSKDAQSYVDRLEYDNVLTDYDMQRANASFEVRNDAVDMYAEEMTRIVLVPTWDQQGEYYMGRTKVGIDDLSLEAEQYSQTAAEDLSQIETNSLTISALDGAEGGEDPVAETLIAEITATLSDYAQAAKIAGQEYSETKLNQCISASVSGFSLLSVLLLCVGGAVAFYLAVSLLGAALRMPKIGREGFRLPVEDWMEDPEAEENHRGAE